MEEVLRYLEQVPLLLPAFIVLARVVDVSLGTIRTICVVRGYRAIAAVLGFFEVTIWIVTASGVLKQITVIKVLAYAGGFALGNVCGVWLENRLAIGQQLVQMISRHRTHAVAFGLRMANHMVTQLPARGGRGEVAMCFVVVPRRKTPEVIRVAEHIDEDVLVTVQDIRQSNLMVRRLGVQATGWRAIMKKK